jgi:hypothetical protein
MILETKPKYFQKVVLKWVISFVEDFIATRKDESHKKGLHELIKALKLKQMRLENK